MSVFKVGDECKIKSLNNGAVFQDCKILYIDNRSIVFSSSASSSSPMSLIDIEFLPLKTPAEIEREAVIELAIKISKKANPDLIMTNNSRNMLGSLYDAGMLGNNQVKPLSRSYATGELRISDGFYNTLVKLGFIVQGGE